MRIHYKWYYSPINILNNYFIKYHWEPGGPASGQRHDSFTISHHNKRIVPLPCLQRYWIFFYPKSFSRSENFLKLPSLHSLSLWQKLKSHCASCVQGSGLSVSSWQPSRREGGSCTLRYDLCSHDLTSPQDSNYHLTYLGNDRAGLGSSGHCCKHFLHTC